MEYLGYTTTKTERYPLTQSMHFDRVMLTAADGPRQAIKFWKPIGRSKHVRAGYLRGRGITWII